MQSLTLEFPMGMGMAPELHPDVWRGQKKFQMTYLTMPNNSSSKKISLKSVSGLAVGVPMGMRSPVTPGSGSG